MYLQGAQTVLAGGLPYVDFVDVNPPLVIYLNMIPAAISLGTNLHVITAFIVCVLLVVCMSVILSYFVLWNQLKSQQYCTFFSLLLVVAAASHASSDYDFGQREFIFLTLYLPFFFLRWMGWEGKKINFALAIICGALAGIGLCLKPYFLLFPILTEGYWQLAKRNWRNILRIEIYTVLSVMVLYGASVFLWPEAMRTAFFDVASHTALYQAAYGKPFLDNLLMRNYPFIFNCMILVLIPVIFLWKRNSQLLPLALFMGAGYLSYVIQGKGYPYHRLPVMTGIMLLAAAEFYFLVQALSTVTSKYLPFLKAFTQNKRFGPDTLQDCIIIAFILGFAALAGQYVCSNISNIAYGLSVCHFHKTGANSPSLDRELSLLTSQDAVARYVSRYSKCGDRILVVTADVLPAFPLLVQFNRLDGSRYPSLMQFAEFEAGKRSAVRANDQSKLSDYQLGENIVLGNLLADAQKFKPRLIITAGKGALYLPYEFSFSEFVRKPGIIQPLLNGYHEVGSVDGQFGKDFYKIYCRDE